MISPSFDPFLNSYIIFLQPTFCYLLDVGCFRIMIHRLAVSRDFAGTGIGKHIITWVENGLQFPSAKKYIRLDCVGDNEKLNAYYVSQGFEKVGSTDGHSNYQKEIGAVFS